MKTAPRVNVGIQLQQLEDLLRQAEDSYETYQKALHNYNSAMTKIADISTKTNEALEEEFASSQASPEAPQKKKRKVRVKSAQKAEAKVKSPHKASVREKNPNPLKKVILEILQRDPSTFREVIKNYPENAVGLKLSEIAFIIQKEGLWKLKSPNWKNIVQNDLYFLRDDKKLHRNEEDRRFTIIPENPANA